MRMHSERKALQGLKPLVAAGVLDGVLGLTRGYDEVLGVIDHPC